MNKQERMRNEEIPDVDVVSVLIDAINESEKRTFRIRMSALFDAVL